MPRISSRPTSKELLFVEEYLVDFNATQAAIRAGYSKTTAHAIGYRNLRKPVLKKLIDDRMKKITKSIEKKGQFVIDNLIKISEMCLGEKPVIKKQKINGEIIEEEQYIFDIRNAISANETLGKHYGLFTTKVEHSGSVGGLTPEEEKEFDDLIEDNI